MEERLVRIREQLPAVTQMVYLNTGTAGPLPIGVQAAMVESLSQQVQNGRITMGYYEAISAQKDALRTVYANLLGCRTDEVALTQNTTDGMNRITMGINWQPGDEAITTNLEHPGALLPLYTARARFGITVKVADIQNQPEQAAEVIQRLITPRTKLISLSHVSFTTGALLPIQAICEVAHRHGVLVLVDAAQSFAALDVNVKELGCDFYAGPGQKWICGPEGTGVLYVARDALSQVQVTFAGYSTAEKFSTYGGFLPQESAKRFDTETGNPANWAGALAAARWFTEEVGPAWAHDRIKRLAALARESLLGVKGVRMLTPPQFAGLITFTVDGATPGAVMDGLLAQGIVARTTPSPSAVRIATGCYNTENEVERTVQAIAAIAANPPSEA